jgi:hypothetical protein
MAKGRKPSRDAKRAHVVVRFQEVELNAIRHHANQLDKPISTTIRDIVLNYFEANGITTQLPTEDPNQLKIDTD